MFLAGICDISMIYTLCFCHVSGWNVHDMAGIHGVFKEFIFLISCALLNNGNMLYLVVSY